MSVYSNNSSALMEIGTKALLQDYIDRYTFVQTVSASFIYFSVLTAVLCKRLNCDQKMQIIELNAPSHHKSVFYLNLN